MVSVELEFLLREIIDLASSAKQPPHDPALTHVLLLLIGSKPTAIS
jgi:hypothetical protein